MEKTSAPQYIIPRYPAVVICSKPPAMNIDNIGDPMARVVITPFVPSNNVGHYGRARVIDTSTVTYTSMEM